LNVGIKLPETVAARSMLGIVTGVISAIGRSMRQAAGCILPLVACIAVETAHSQAASSRAGNEIVRISYSGPGKTIYILKMTEAIAKYYGHQIVHDDIHPTLFVYGDDGVFDRFLDENYVKTRFKNSAYIQNLVKKENYSGRICISFRGRKLNGEKFALIFFDSMRKQLEIEACVLMMLQGALKVDVV